MNKISIRRRLALGTGASAILVAAMAGPALAANEVTQAITGSGLTASVADLTLPSVAYQNGAHNVTGTMILTADDSTGSGAGWNVTIQSSDFVWVGHGERRHRHPCGRSSRSRRPRCADLGRRPGHRCCAVHGSPGPADLPLGTLDSPRKTLVATAAYGAGTYTQSLGVTLTIPAQSRVGVYTGTLTTTITSAP